MSLHYGTLLAELKRRRVFRVAAVYLAAAFVVAQAAELYFPRLGFPEWTVPFVLMLELIGFPAAVALAWAFDVGPGGVQRTEAPPRPVPVRLEPAANSIAVLPFANMSRDQEDELFSDGLTEEIIADLSHVRALRVISRTSVMAVKNVPRDLPTIARRLGARYVLEGSVRRSGRDLRVTAQLIDATSDTHLWAEKYNGTADDVFAIQERVSRAIVDALSVRLAPDEDRRIATRPFGSVVAYETFLRARQELWQFTPQSIERALQLARQATQQLGEHPLFLVIEGSVHWQHMHAGVVPVSEYRASLERAAACARRAIALDATVAAAHVLLAEVCNNAGDPTGAQAAAHEAVRLDPGYPDALMWLGWIRAAAGDDERGRALYTRVHEVAPLDAIPHQAGGLVAMLGGRQADAATFRKDVAALATGSWFDRFGLAWLDAYAGELTAAAQVVEELSGQSSSPVWNALAPLLVAAWRGDREGTLRALTPELTAAACWDDQVIWLIADALAHVGADVQALEWIDRAIDYGLACPAWWEQHDPFLSRLRRTPEFRRVLGRAHAKAAELDAALQGALVHA